jgi:hypothetical protein
MVFKGGCSRAISTPPFRLAPLRYRAPPGGSPRGLGAEPCSWSAPCGPYRILPEGMQAAISGRRAGLFAGHAEF